MAYANGAGSLVSLTFDDGLDCHKSVVLDVLAWHRLTATFFLIGADNCDGPRQDDVWLANAMPDSSFDAATWRDAYGFGHEIGSHSVNHRKAHTLSVGDCVWEAQESKRYLEDKIGGRVTSFCYPFTDAPAPLQGAVQGCGYTQARGGRGAKVDKYLQPGDGTNLFNTPCFHVGPQTIYEAGEWISTNSKRGTWLTLMFHGVDDVRAWDNISLFNFVNLCGKLRDAADTAVVTFAQGAALYRAGRCK
jgi:peptidoglycan/xylan/chitin deacetylase (PgdA/CDA1 family)